MRLYKHGSIINNYRLRERGVSFWSSFFVIFGIVLDNHCSRKTKNLIMKAILTMFALMLVTGAFAQRGNLTNVSTTTPTRTNVKGVVSHFEGRACDFYITATIDGQEVKYVPLNLPDEFDVDGLKIVFDFVLTEERVNEQCVTAAVNVSNVKLQKIK